MARRWRDIKAAAGALMVAEILDETEIDEIITSSARDNDLARDGRLAASSHRAMRGSRAGRSQTAYSLTVPACVG